jgi:Ca2+-binding EF-hand superfamily protein
MNQIRKAFRTTKVKASNFGKEQQQEIEQAFMVLEAAKTDAVAAERAAGINLNKAQVKRAEAQTAEIRLLEIASTADNRIAGERVWLIYKDKDGIITFEGLTERLMRNNFRAQQELMGQQLQNNEDGDVDRSDLYEEDQEDPGEAK